MRIMTEIILGDEGFRMILCKEGKRLFEDWLNEQNQLPKKTSKRKRLKIGEAKFHKYFEHRYRCKKCIGGF